MESKLDSGSESAAEEDQRQTRSTLLPKRRRRIRRALIGAVLGAGLIGLSQWIAPSTDHQYANFASLAVGLVSTIYVIVQFQGLAREKGRRLLVPKVLLLVLIVLVVLLRFEGFSGEMLPQFRYRFAKQPPGLRSLGGGARPEISGDRASETMTAQADSLGFLGTDRTGVIPQRLFAIPSEPSQVRSLWNQGIGKGWSSFAVSGDRAVTLEQREELECVTCYRLSDGELMWMVTHEACHQNALGGIGPRSTPTIVGDLVYSQGATGRVWCLDLKSGETKWTVDLLELAGWNQIESEAAIIWGRAASPLLVDGLCIVPYGGPEANEETGRSLIAFDAQTGGVRWTSGEDQISYASPGLLTLGGKRHVVSVNEKTITGHRVEDGSLLWEFEWFGRSNAEANCAMVIPAGDDQFLIGKGYGGGSALVEVTAKSDGALEADLVWDSTRVLKTKFTHACVDGAIAYAIGNGALEAVTIADGERRWQQPRRSRFAQGQILLVEDTIVAQAESGEVVLVAVDPEEYRELLRIPALDSKTWNIPTIAGRHLLVRNDRQAMCFLLPAKAD